MRLARWTCFSLVLITAVTYWDVQLHEVAYYGDALNIQQAPQISTGFSLEGLRWAFTETGQPLTALSHMLDIELYGKKSGGHHRTSLLLHLLNVLLLFSVLRRMTGAFWPSTAVTALFAIHPLQVESVAWVAARVQLLSTFFCLLTISAYLQYVSWRGTARYLVVAAFFSLSLIVNPALIVLPFILLLIDYWPLGRLHGQDCRESWAQSSASQLVTEKLPFLLLALIAGLAMGWPEPIGTDAEGLPFAASELRLANAAVTYANKLAMTFYPRNLAIFYSHPGESLSLATIAACSALLLLITAFALKGAPRRPYLAVGWLWYLIALIPWIGLIPLSPPDMADRYSYFPLIGLFLAIVFGVSNATAGWKHRGRIFAAVLGACLLALIAVTRAQVAHWQDSVTLWEHAIRLNPENPIAQRNIAAVLVRFGQSKKAIEHLRQAVATAPEFADAHSRLGKELADLGDLTEADHHLTMALATNPDNAVAHYNLGRVRFLQGNFQEAIEQFDRAIAIRSDYLDARRGISVVLSQEGRFKEAIDHLQIVIDQEPSDALAYFQLAAAQSQLSQVDSAISTLKKGLEIAPKTEAAQRFLAELERRRAKKKREHRAQPLPAQDGLDLKDEAQRAEVELSTGELPAREGVDLPALEVLDDQRIQPHYRRAE